VPFRAAAFRIINHWGNPAEKKMSVARAGSAGNDWFFHFLVMWTCIIVWWAFLSLVYEVVTAGY